MNSNFKDLFKFTGNLRLYNGNGYGSTNTKIRRFGTLINNECPYITYTDSAANGGSFTIVENGVYSIFYNDITSSVNGYYGLSLNSTQLTTNLASINFQDRIAYTYGDTNGAPIINLVMFFKAGDVIRAHHGAGVSTSGSDTAVKFYMTRVI